MRTMNFDAIATAAPLNRDAAIARDGSGEHFVSRVQYTGIHSELPLPTKPLPANAPDLVGRRVGRLVVIGLYVEPVKAGARWVVRCVCGHYETRRAKAICNPLNTDDRCFECDRTDILRKRANRPVNQRSRADEVALLDGLARAQG